MLKQSLALAALLATGTSVAIADGMASAKAQSNTFNTYSIDPYVGLSIGPLLTVSGTPFTYAGFSGTLSAGLSHVWQKRFYLAGEVFGTDSGKIKSFGVGSLPLSIYNLRSNWSYGFDLIPGLMLKDDLLGYLRVGVINTQFDMDSAIGGIGKNLTGWQVGLGFQTHAYKNLDARVEYIFSEYSNTTNPPISTLGASQLNLGLVYQFA